MLDFNNYDEVFSFNPDYTYPREKYGSILHRRRQLEGKLFIDRLFDTLQLDVLRFYPPQTNHNLREIHTAIANAPLAAHYKQSLLFYILKDCASKSNDPSEDFYRAVFLPEQFYIVLSGLWLMDNFQFTVSETLPWGILELNSARDNASIQPTNARQNALNHLATPAVPSTFSPEILSALLSHEPSLALPYYHTMTPSLSGDLLYSFVAHLSKISPARAFSFARQHPPTTHRELLKTILSSVLTHSRKDRPDNGIEVVEFPMNEDEEKWFEDYLLHGEGRQLVGATETVYMRKLALGKITDAIEVGKELPDQKLAQRGNGEGVSWGDLKAGLKAGIGQRGEQGFAL
ncbi:hypothetical protein M501DRAFT_1016613 [Patellaria atrata CBS 101060]|uniref:ELYS-like domain-containing protein n=1 Tax=Patellaria atrata CBS 101060 TaxID=1346257 RepID=A0A9P4SBD9_9PEZI|nr:hypothetical protein M501DRAFT_1016613 [Patellaria atrata CBS 101060]